MAQKVVCGVEANRNVHENWRFYVTSWEVRGVFKKKLPTKSATV